MPTEITYSVHRTPNARGDEAWSVGVLGMSRDEAEMICMLARELQGARSRGANVAAITIPFVKRLSTTTMTQTRGVIVEQPVGTAEPEPDAPATRFSGGLDLD